MYDYCLWIFLSSWRQSLCHKPLADSGQVFEFEEKILFSNTLPELAVSSLFHS